MPLDKDEEWIAGWVGLLGDRRIFPREPAPPKPPAVVQIRRLKTHKPTAEYKPHPAKPADGYPARDRRMLGLRQGGATVAELAKTFDLSRARVQQILNRAPWWMVRSERLERQAKIIAAFRRKTLLNRPLDMGGRRGVWMTYRIGDPL